MPRKGEQAFEVDDLDAKILKELVADARQSFRKIAQKLGVSTATVAKRVEKLEKSGIIKGYTAVVDHEKLGYDLTAVIEITISEGKLLEVERELARVPNVFVVYDVTGQSDSIIIAKFRSRKELNDLVKRILAMKYVERTNTRVVLNTVKENVSFV